ncbi:hypothetical protein GCM10023220_67530 [Streptomyces ziwulingensis]|uniref:Uncharacterized protein n=1 Tax=Streptomyces ziwulingensis TaxID=1045501 RepID=A0ABP9D1W2_9ACTN
MTAPPNDKPAPDAGCATCGGQLHDSVRDGCTPRTCTTPCTHCGHPGDVHRDWYREQRGTGFCHRCPSGQAVRLHDYTPAAGDQP